jgi:hypothetical protein
VAVVYAVMVEPGYNRTELGKIILAACFINDVDTVLALGLIFGNYNLYLAIFVVVTIAVGAVVLTLLAGTDIDGSSVSVGLMGFVAPFLGCLVLARYGLGLVVAASPNRRHHLVLNLSRQTYSTAGECAVQDRAKQFPRLTVKPLHLHLLDRREISRAGIDRDPRQEHSDL